MSPDLNKLGHFVAVAESLNFTRAAGRLHMAQQALSSSIRRLEQELGVQLFVRSTRHVTLTDAGRHLLQEGRPLLASSQATWDSVRRIDRGEPALVRVGHTPTVPREQLDAYIIAWRVSSPTSGIVITQRWIGGLVRGVADGELDVGLCRVIEPEPGLVLTTLGQRPLRVAMAVGHPFATRRSLGLADLAEERILESDLADPRSQQYHEFFVGLCRGAGFEPTLVPTPVQGSPPIAAVAGTSDVALVDAPAGPLPGGQVLVRDLRPTPLMPVCALTRRTLPSALVTDFLTTAVAATGADGA